MKAIGPSNMEVNEILGANRAHPVSAVQYEYSLFRREAGADILPAVRSIGAVLVCWSPLGAGFLTGTIKELDANDFRNHNPKMQSENFSSNLERLEGIKNIASELSMTPAQLALAWLIAQGEDIIPTPVSRKISRIEENLASLDMSLSFETLQALDSITPMGAFKGATLV